MSVCYLCMHIVYIFWPCMCVSAFTFIENVGLEGCLHVAVIQGARSPFIAEEWGLFTHAVRVTALTSITRLWLELQAVRMHGLQL